MTDESTKTFFETFGIEPIKYKRNIDDNAMFLDKVYPPITYRILLELICIAHTSPVITFTSRDIKSLKEEVLLVLCNCISHRDIKHQVQELFKENN